MSGGPMLLNRTLKSVSTGSTLLQFCSTETHFFHNQVCGELILYPEHIPKWHFTLHWLIPTTNKEILLYYNETGQAQYQELEAFYKVFWALSYLFVLECFVRQVWLIRKKATNTFQSAYALKSNVDWHKSSHCKSSFFTCTTFTQIYFKQTWLFKIQNDRQESHGTFGLIPRFSRACTERKKCYPSRHYRVMTHRQSIFYMSQTLTPVAH